MSIIGIRINGVSPDEFKLVNFKEAEQEIMSLSKDEQIYQIKLAESIDDEEEEEADDFMIQEAVKKHKPRDPDLMNPASGRKRAVGQMDRALLEKKPVIEVKVETRRKVRIDKKTEGYALEGESDEHCIARYKAKFLKL